MQHLKDHVTICLFIIASESKKVFAQDEIYMWLTLEVDVYEVYSPR